PNKLNSPPSQGEELVKTCITEGKPTAVDKKTCICAPSTHAASFKCHLHRTNEAQKSSSSKDSKNKSDLLITIKICERTGQELRLQLSKNPENNLNS
ncbi:hypothetical protein RGQ29_031434, partial [Quercus rubra]